MGPAVIPLPCQHLIQTNMGIHLGKITWMFLQENVFSLKIPGKVDVEFYTPAFTYRMATSHVSLEL